MFQPFYDPQNAPKDKITIHVENISLTFSVAFQGTMVRVGWRRSRTWQPRKASVLLTQVRAEDV